MSVVCIVTNMLIKGELLEVESVRALISCWLLEV